MKGAFAVSELYELELGYWGLAGRVISGNLEAGMEARHDAIVIIIRELKAIEDPEKPLKRARKGLKAVVVPLATVREVLEVCIGQTLEFEDVRSVPIAQPMAVGVQ